MTALCLAFGAIVGLSLGLTGGGGAIFAVPLLVYGLGQPPREAVGISLAAVGATALAGFAHRWMRGEVELRTGMILALAGLPGAWLGTRLAAAVPERLLLALFAGLMLVVAWRLFRQAARAAAADASRHSEQPPLSSACQRDAAGSLRLTSRCALVLAAAGVATGILSGLFGVGGGFVIVPALVLTSGMAIHRAVGTSLLVISLVSAGGLVSRLIEGRAIDLTLSAQFVAGGMAGLFAGGRLARRLSGPALQKVFSVAMVGVALFVVWRNWSS